MKVWIFENNLMWSSRLLQSVNGVGHEGAVVTQILEEGADVAIVNLGDSETPSLVKQLKDMGVFVIAHAGHKEKELLTLGKDLQVDRLATNSELTFKLPQILETIQK
jgi:protein-L-isoaspartate O-methyltransferase